MSERLRVLGCPVDLLDPRSLPGQLRLWAESNALTDVVTLNPEQIMAARRDCAVSNLFGDADVFTVDGVGLQLALRLRGVARVSRITGVDLVTALAESGIPIYLLGGASGSAEAAADRLGRSIANARLVGAWSGGTPNPADDPQSISRIANAGARAVAVAYGAPAQTAWIERNREQLQAAGVRIAVGVGGALDYHSGLVRRAPAPVRRAGLEWLYRLVREPWRLRRQRVLPVFAVLALSEAMRHRLPRS
jgi:N-acetylglucosaminyldiphosphoundecaprenol N-acetyl-beta-D-mannosaminyltransferase